jgi:outer membrane protein
MRFSTNRFLVVMATIGTLGAGVQAQETAPATNANQGGQTPAAAPIQDGIATMGTQGPAGGSSQSALPLIQVPEVASAGLADVRNQLSENAPVLSLEKAVLEALENNPSPKQARAARDAALARIGIVASQGKPQANLGAGVDTQRAFGRRNGSGSGSSTSETLSLNVALPVYSGGRVKNSRRSAEATARAAVATAQQTEQELAAQTIIAYLGALQSQELLQVSDSNLATSRERRRVAGVRFEAGAAARLEVLRADSDLATAQQNRIQAANSLAQSKAALNILLARNPEEPLQIERVTTLELPAVARFPLAEQATAIARGEAAPTSPELRELADERLPRLQATREQVTAAEFNVEAQKAQKKPQLDISLTGLLRNPVEAAGRFILSAGASLAQSLLSGGRISSQVREARSQLDQTKFSQQGQNLQVANAIEGSLLNLDSSTKRLASTDISVLAAQEALRAAQLGYSAGALTVLDVIDAQNALVSAQTAAVNARYSVAQAQVQLAAATAVTTSGSATGSSGLGTSAGTGQSSTVSTSGANQTGGAGR